MMLYFFICRFDKTGLGTVDSVLFFRTLGINPFHGNDMLRSILCTLALINRSGSVPNGSIVMIFINEKCDFEVFAELSNLCLNAYTFICMQLKSVQQRVGSWTRRVTELMKK